MFKAILILIAILLGMMMFTYINFGGAAEQPAHGALPSVETNPPPVGGPFTLTDDHGQTVTEKSLIGQYTLLFFGFTHCADVCPTMLSSLAQAAGQLTPGKRVKLHVVFVSVDHERDTPRTVGDYAHSFDPAFTGWTGTKEQLDQMVKSYLVYYGITKDDKGNPVVSHSDILYLMGPDGKYLAHFRHADSPAAIAAKLSALIH